MSLSLKGIKKAFGEKNIFDGFSYDFSDTGLYLIKGDSGIGKTTLLRIISGIDKNFTGSITGGGIKNVSFAFQEYRLFPQLNMLENLTKAVYEKATENDVLKAKNILLSLGFSENDFHLFPNELSGGMKQRVSLARAFLRKTPILLLDEPTKELDETLCKNVRALISKESESRLVIMVSHSEADMELLNPVKIDLNSIK